MTFHLTEESLARFQEKRKQWEREGRITTHRLDASDAIAHGRAAKESRSKYHNVRTEAEGIKFHSKKEARRWKDLRLLEMANRIRDLKRQVRFKLDVNGVRICDYFADFVYEKDGALVVEDCKGMRLPIYALKAKLMLAVHNIKILET